MSAAARFFDVDGVRLAVALRGAGPAVVLLHGFGGSARDLAPLAESLAARWRVLAIDLVGHGDSEAPRDPDAYTMERCARQLAGVIQAADAAPAHVFGYSMGGRTALYLAVRRPDLVRSLALLGASAGLADPRDRAARRASDAALAARIERDGVAAWASAWSRLPLFATQQRTLSAPERRALHTRRLANRAHGLAGSLRGMGTGAQAALHASLRGVQVPVWLGHGADDAKFAAIADDLARRLPRASRCAIPRAGHAAHLENRDAVAGELARFFARAERVSRPPPAGGPAPRGARRPTVTEGPLPRQVWKTVKGYEDIRFERTDDGVAKITICRPEVRNAFRPRTLFELCDAFSRAREDQEVGVVLFTGEGPDAFCSGGDQRVRGDAGYVDDAGVPRLNVLDLQRLIRTMPKPVIALVAGYAIGGGHVLHLICDLTIAAENARFGQTGPRVGSFDAGFGASYLARVVGQKKAREIWYLCRQYDARQAQEMGLVNEVVPLEALEATGVAWAREILRHSPIAIRCLKAAFNADCDGQAGLQELAGHATQLFYMTEEAQEGRNAFVEKREPDFARFPWRP